MNPKKPVNRMGLLGATLVAAAGFSTQISAQTLTAIHAFSGTDGSNPGLGRLLLDRSGALYGTTTQGGSGGSGTVFRLTPNGNGTYAESVLHSFSDSDGAFPASGLIADAAGALYGTTQGGGSINDGTVFKLTPSATIPWPETVLHSFSGSDGDQLFSDLIADAAGALYGTSEAGGTSNGLVFKLTPSATTPWPATVLHDFSGDDGALPFAGLIADASGALYGTTDVGGAGGLGTVFKLTPNGNGTYTENVLHSFGGSDGATTSAGLMADAAGALYGITFAGGANNLGAVFKLTPNGNGTYTESVLHSFSGNDGAFPEAALLIDASGALYGTTSSGGADNAGTVFKLTPSTTSPWPETVLHSFNGTDGDQPIAGLVADASGALYGTTLAGGTDDQGTVFKLTGSGFVVPSVFAGTPGAPNCIGKSISSLARKYGGIAHAASALDYPSVTDLQNAIDGFCAG